MFDNTYFLVMHSMYYDMRWKIKRRTQFAYSGPRLEYAQQRRRKGRRLVPEYAGRVVAAGPVLRQVSVEKRDGPARQDDVPQLPGEKLGQQDGE